MRVGKLDSDKYSRDKDRSLFMMRGMCTQSEVDETFSKDTFPIECALQSTIRNKGLKKIKPLGHLMTEVCYCANHLGTWAGQNAPATSISPSASTLHPRYQLSQISSSATLSLCPRYALRSSVLGWLVVSLLLFIRLLIKG